jgi:hypothetical protein
MTKLLYNSSLHSIITHCSREMRYIMQSFPKWELLPLTSASDKFTYEMLNELQL